MAAACCGGMAMSRAIPNCGTWVQNRAAYEELRDLVPSGSCLSLCRQPSSQHGQLDRACCMVSSSFWGRKSQAISGLSRSSRLRIALTQCQRHTGTNQIVHAAWDPDLHVVMELASDSELQEVSNILYGASLFSPLVKSVAPGDGSNATDIHEAIRLGQEDGRDAFVERLESRFLFLAADAKATISGRRPRYRDVLLSVRRKLQIPCSVRLTTEDLEAEIFLYLLNEYSRKPKAKAAPLVDRRRGPSFVNDVRELKSRRWDENILTALKLGGEGLFAIALKGGSAVTMSTLQTAVSKELSGKVLVESVRYKLAKDAMLKGGQAIATKLESHVAVLAARQGLAGATARYFTLRSTMMLIGPLMWGTFLADVVIKSLGTDYARVIRAIFAFAQIRITRTYGWTQSDVA